MHLGVTPKDVNFMYYLRMCVSFFILIYLSIRLFIYIHICYLFTRLLICPFIFSSNSFHLSHRCHVAVMWLWLRFHQNFLTLRREKIAPLHALWNTNRNQSTGRENRTQTVFLPYIHEVPIIGDVSHFLRVARKLISLLVAVMASTYTWFCIQLAATNI